MNFDTYNIVAENRVAVVDDTKSAGVD